MKMKEKDEYIKKLSKKIDKLTKLRNLLLSDEKKLKEINNGRVIPIITSKSEQSLREVVKNKPLTNNEFYKAKYKGVRPLDIIMDETYEKYKDLKLYHSDTIESIKNNTNSINLNEYDHKNNIHDEVTLNLGEQDTPKRPELDDKPKTILEEIDKNSFLTDEQLIEMLNKTNEDEIKSSLIDFFKKGEKVSLESLLYSLKKVDNPQDWTLSLFNGYNGKKYGMA